MLVYKVVFFSFSLLMPVRAAAMVDLRTRLSPVSHTYTHQLLKDARVKLPSNNIKQDLSSYVRQLKTHWELYNIYPLSINGYCPLTSSMMLNAGIDGEDVLGFVYRSQAFHNRDKGLKEWLFDNLRGNLVFTTKRYQKNAYMRFGYDYTPLGHHLFELRRPQDVMTQASLKRKNFVAEIGTSYEGSISRVYTSLAYAKAINAGVFTLQYDCKSSNLEGIERYTTGGGIGISSQMNIYFSLYHHIDFARAFGMRFEYFGHHLWRHSTLSPHFLHVEGVKQFKRMPISNRYIPFAILLGYEQGTPVVRVNGMHTAWSKQSILAGFKLTLLKQVTLLLGLEYDLKSGARLPLERIQIAF